MENQFTQLRFDISEKVRLHPQQPGIDALLELDLYPDVEIKDEGQHLKIQGYLRLNGVYVEEAKTAAGEEYDLHNESREEETNELAYVIPVEITLPADRADQSRISAEVETFDYEVLSPFELKIEAILMIDGLLPENREEEEARTDQEQKYPVFSGSMAQPLVMAQEHAPEEDGEKEKAYLQPYQEQKEFQNDPGVKSPKAEEEEKTENEEVHAEVLEPAPKDRFTEPKGEKPEEKTENAEAGEKILSPEKFWCERQKTRTEEAKTGEEPASLTNAEEEKAEKAPDSEQKREEMKTEKSPESMEKEKEEETKAAQEVPGNEKEEETKVAQEVPGKEEEKTKAAQETASKMEAEETEPSGEKVKKAEDQTIRENVVQKQEKPAGEEDPIDEEEAGEATSGEENGEQEANEKAEWIRWLVQGKEENFVPIKMVIVQEDETIDHLAGKYEVSKDWLIKVNRLTTDQLEPGQILQVPESGTKKPENREGHSL